MMNSQAPAFPWPQKIPQCLFNKTLLDPKTGINKQNKLINPSGYVKHSKLCSEHGLHLFFGGKIVAGESIRALVISISRFRAFEGITSIKSLYPPIMSTPFQTWDEGRSIYLQLRHVEKHQKNNASWSDSTQTSDTCIIRLNNSRIRDAISIHIYLYKYIRISHIEKPHVTKIEHPTRDPDINSHALPFWLQPRKVQLGNVKTNACEAKLRAPAASCFQHLVMPPVSVLSHIVAKEAKWGCHVNSLEWYLQDRFHSPHHLLLTWQLYKKFAIHLRVLYKVSHINTALQTALPIVRIGPSVLELLSYVHQPQPSTLQKLNQSAVAAIQRFLS